MTEKTKLKPCPFCGGEAYLVGKEGKVFAIECGSCFFKIGATTEKDVVEYWNTRPIEDALQAENKRFRKALETICSIYEINGAEWRFDKRLYDEAKEALKGKEKDAE